MTSTSTSTATPTAGSSRASRPAPLDLQRRAVTVQHPTETERVSPVSDEDGTTLARFIEYLTAPEHADVDPRLMQVGYELEALLAIYPGAVRLSGASRAPTHAEPSPRGSLELARPPPPPPLAEPHAPVAGPSSSAGALLASLSAERGMSRARSEDSLVDAVDPAERIRYEVVLPAWEAGDAPAGTDGAANADLTNEPPRLRVLVSLPPTYPATSPPQLQLLGRYVGSFPIDAGLFGDITRTYITTSGVPFKQGDVCVFEGLQHVQSLARAWYGAHLSAGAAGERERAAARGQRQGEAGRAYAAAAGVDGASVDEGEALAAVAAMSLSGPPSPDRASPALPAPLAFPLARPSPLRPTFSYSHAPARPAPPITSSAPIVDRKSSFVGHAATVTDETDVPLVIHRLLSDKKIAKAAHPAIFAYRIVRDVGGAAGRVVYTDYDDDGETQAGARLAHLLDILELENVLVVVSRWYGGTLLGADRFKHINQAARDALELAGLLDDDKNRKGAKGRKK
ncbi:hypothetical protein Q5752_000078 [Cryptotrichosporon argae]